MNLNKVLLAAVVTAGIAATSGAYAYPVTVMTQNTNGSSFDASQGGLTGGISAAFTYTGPLSFAIGNPQNNASTGDLNSAFFASGTISNYTGSGTLPGPANANFTSLSTFLGSSGSAAGFQYGSLYSFDLGVLAAGTVLTITHDDGASVYQGKTRIGTTTSGPTTAVTENVTVAAAGDTVLYYARENGAPSVLKVAVPEPVSIALLGSSLVAFGAIRRSRSRAA